MATADGDETKSGERSGRTGLALACCVLGLACFSCGDAVTKLLVRDYPVAQIVFIRSTAFLTFATCFAVASVGWRRSVTAHRPLLQVVRGLLLVIDSSIYATSIRFLGLAEVSAIYATAPVIATALAVLLLGERVGWRRWLAVAVGFAGALLIIDPGGGVVSASALIALSGATMWGAYGLATRLAAKTDGFATCLFYIAAVSTIAAAPLGIFYWRPPDAQGWMLFAIITVLGVSGHMLLIRAYQLVDASVLQPFLYLGLVFTTTIGVVVYGESLALNMIIGVLIVVASGLYIGWREHVRGRQLSPPQG